MTEAGCAWVPPLLERLDWALESIRKTGATGEIRYSDDHVLPRSATDYFRQNVWMGVSQPGPADVAARHQIGLDRFMWGSDYPHDEGTHPYTREHLRARFSDVDPSELKLFLSENAAKLYDFDLAALAPMASKFGPTVGEIAEPIDAIPDKALERLSGDMDPKAIK
jgi:predicted TIM-barrel fold metal-dependent hydrolase